MGKLRLEVTRLIGTGWNLLWIKPLLACLGEDGRLALSLEECLCRWTGFCTATLEALKVSLAEAERGWGPL